MSGSLRLLIVLLCPIVLRAGQVDWSNGLFSTNVQSNGERMDSQMTFELGVFVAGFTPTTANTAQWSANWRRAQLAFYNTELSYFAGSHTVTSNAAPFTAGTKGYIWGHDGGCTNGEWILMSAPSWTWPTQSTIELPVSWTVSSATQFILGQGNGSGFQMRSAPGNGPLPVTSWQEWSARMFNAAQLNNPDISGAGSDPDGDGMTNLGEYAFGGHPFTAGPMHWRVQAGLTTAGNSQRLTLTVTKRCDRPLLWSAQASADLVHWSAASVNLTDTPELFTAVESLSTGGGTRVFMRPVFQLP